ncbi:MAG: RagB/SusD family nutrient uptake outer membrane protein [Alistipes sp.]|nr:RagB/SusD family nutrient uptake outer membrane protein [Alistipes sp.]
MKAKPYIAAIAALTLIGMASCDSFFEVDAREVATEEDIIKNDSEITNLWRSMYRIFENGFQYVDQVAMLANACDEADFNQPNAAVQMFNTGSWNEVNNPDNHWYYDYYAMIRHACEFLELTDVENNPRLDYMEYYHVDMVKYQQMVLALKSYRMDADFFKAYCHFELMKRFGEIPIVDKVLTENEARGLKRNSIAEVTEYIVEKLDGIIPQFDELEQMPTTEYTDGAWNGNNLGRITKGAALALKTKTLLYAGSPLYTEDGQYDRRYLIRAAQAAGELIGSGVYSTGITYRALQSNRMASNPENILDARHQVASNTGTDFEKWNYPKSGLAEYLTSVVGTNATCPSQNLVDAYQTRDGSPADPADPYSNLDPRFHETVLYNGAEFNGATVQTYTGGVDEPGGLNQTTTGYYLKKFVQNEIRLSTGSAVRVWYIFRYSDVLLQYAEAMFHAYGPNARMGYVSGDDLSALEAVNLVRAREEVEMPPLTTLTTELIRNERRVELAFEGHRFWDVRRWKIASETENLPLRGIRVTRDAQGVFTYEKTEVEPRTFEEKMYRFPIPHKEMMQYPAWKQNPGW